jgi:rhodanese-related sulfurtransferase
MPDFSTITVEEVDARRKTGDKFRLIDVREPGEFRVAHIDGAELKPLGQILQWMSELTDKDEDIVLHCHHGMRSEQASSFLSRQGFTRVSNMAGGIEAWSARIDPSVPRY